MILEFFSNIWNGIVQNKDVIFTIIGGAEVGTLVGMIASFFRSRKDVKDNTGATTQLNEALVQFTDVGEQLDNCTDAAATALSEVRTLSDEVSALKEQNSILLSKLDAILNVQSIVYSTSIKDVSTRTTVTNILSNAKHIETSQMLKLKEKLESLQEKVVEKAKAVEEEVTQAIKDADTVIKVTADSLMRC